MNVYFTSNFAQSHNRANSCVSALLSFCTNWKLIVDDSFSFYIVLLSIIINLFFCISYVTTTRGELKIVKMIICIGFVPAHNRTWHYADIRAVRGSRWRFRTRCAKKIRGYLLCNVWLCMQIRSRTTRAMTLRCSPRKTLNDSPSTTFQTRPVHRTRSTASARRCLATWRCFLLPLNQTWVVLPSVAEQFVCTVQFV